MGPTFLNTNECAWKDITLRIAGKPVAKIQGVKYGVSTDKEHLFAQGDEAIGIQSGNKKPSGTFSILRGALRDLNAAAVAAGGRDITDVSFDAVVEYRADNTRPIEVVTIESLEVSDFQVSYMQGDMKAIVELPWLALRIF